MLYGFNRDHARILKGIARREGLAPRAGTKVKYPKPLADEFYLRIGKPDANIAKGASGTVSLWGGSPLADTGDNVTAKALGAAVTSAKYVTLFYVEGVLYCGCWES